MQEGSAEADSYRRYCSRGPIQGVLAQFHATASPHGAITDEIFCRTAEESAAETKRTAWIKGGDSLLPPKDNGQT